MADTPTPTPPPIAADETGGYQCPYRDEVHLIRRLRKAGIEEQTIVGRRRDRLATVLAGAALAAVLTLGGGALAGGWSLARAVGRSEARLEQLERQTAGATSSASQLARLDARLEGLEERLGDRLEQIERRLDRSEDRSRETNRHRRDRR